MKGRILLTLFLLVAACHSADKTNPTVVTTGTPLQKTAVAVDAQYDLSSCYSYSLYDSSSLKNPGATINTAKATTSNVFFFDNSTRKIMAVVRVTAGQTSLKVTADNVARSLFVMMPAYQLITPAQQAAFENLVTGNAAFTALTGTVDTMLKNKIPLYDTNANYLNQVMAVNQLIVDTYLSATPAGGKKTHTKGATTFVDWLPLDKNVISNQLSSYISVTATPATGAPTKVLLDPKPFVLATSYQTDLSKLKDDCYKVLLSQKTDEAKLKNFTEFVKAVVSLSLSAVFGKVDTNHPCLNSITSSVVGSFYGTTMDALAAGQSEDSVFSGVLSMVKEALLTVLGDEKCITSLLSIRSLTEATIQCVAFVSKVYNLAANITTAVSAYILLDALVPANQVELSQTLEIYKANVVPGCVGLKSLGSIGTSFSAGAVVNPGVFIDIQSSYGAIKMNKFDIKWVVQPNNGTLSATSTPTDATGNARVSWTLPKPDGKYTLTAELRDAEGDLIGSTVPFIAEVSTCPDLPVMDYQGLSPINTLYAVDTAVSTSYDLQFHLLDKCNKIGAAQSAGIQVTTTWGKYQYSDMIDLKSSAGNADYTVTSKRSSSWTLDRKTGVWCCQSTYKFELMLDGKVVSTATGAGPPH